jgi:FAD/FMN-containing dehydrogenase
MADSKNPGHVISIGDLPEGRIKDIVLRRQPIADRDAQPPPMNRPRNPPITRPRPRPQDDASPIGPVLDRCLTRSRAAARSLAMSEDRFWQNWGKTRSFVADRMLFPTTVDELAAAVRRAEIDDRPVRAIGGGWSFSDVNVPGDVGVVRPYSLGVEGIASLTPLSEAFPEDPADPIVASTLLHARIADQRGSLVMFNALANAIDDRWHYQGSGVWTADRDARHEVLQQFPISPGVGPGSFEPTDAELVELAFYLGYRPTSEHFGDGPGTLLVVRDDRVSSFFLYNGNGLWTTGPFSASPRSRTFQQLLEDYEGIYVQTSSPSTTLKLYYQTKPVYLINTQSMASSLQQHLPNILSAAAVERTAGARPAAHYFHVEAGITMSALIELLSRQSPRLAMQATGGNPGATLAGSLATGTHGGEHAWPLLSDRVKAIHFVGPGGLQWWFEGTDSIADPEKLLAAYPCLSRDRIVTGATAAGGLRGQDWIDALVVSLGCMGVIYSIVLEVVPLFGIHEVAVETTWTDLLAAATFDGAAITQELLRTGVTGETDREVLGGTIVQLLEDGERNGTGIHRDNNRYVDLAIDPNPFGTFPPSSFTGLGPPAQNWRCWVLNREQTATIPFDPKPTPKDRMGLIASKLGAMLERPRIQAELKDILNIEFIDKLDSFWTFLEGIGEAVHQLPGLIDRWIRRGRRLASSGDAMNAGLDLMTDLFGRSPVVARGIIDAVLSGILGIEDGRADSTDVCSKVGAIGFPAGGIVGAAIEIALPAEHAWSFLQTEILDRVTEPLFGYVSVRITPPARAHLAMQQWDPTVHIEVVAFGTAYGRRFVRELEARTVARIRDGLDAMLHWGLENEQLDADALRAIPALASGSTPKLARFLMARLHLHAALPADTPRVFDSAATRRLNLG